MPVLAGVSFMLMRVVQEYEDDNYEFLQQFQRVPADVLLASLPIRNYIFDSSLSEVDNFGLAKFFEKICSCRFISPLLSCCLCRFGGKRRKIVSTLTTDESSSKLAEEIFQSCPTPVISCSINGSISFFSRNAMKCFEYEQQTDVIGVNVNKLFSINSKLIISGFLKNLQKTASDPSMFSKKKDSLVKEERVVALRKSGKEFPCILSIDVLVIRGQLSIALFVTDVANMVQHDALIQEEKARSERLLLNILPVAVAKRLSDGEQLICESFPDVTCFFSDIVGFTSMSSKITAWELIKLFVSFHFLSCFLLLNEKNRLNDIVNGFDEIADMLTIEKIKTIGDAYFAVSGLHYNANDHPQKMVLFAIKARFLFFTFLFTRTQKNSHFEFATDLCWEKSTRNSCQLH